jgi:hypothetical protein
MILQKRDTVVRRGLRTLAMGWRLGAEWIGDCKLLRYTKKPFLQLIDQGYESHNKLKLLIIKTFNPISSKGSSAFSVQTD